jgi:UDP-N-acetylmuramoyl-tripeptide--D-alanyl-D-alanine ligase
MGIVWNNTTLSRALGLDLKAHFVSSGKIEFNSKDVEKGDIFIALKGENRNGHEFIDDAIARGASLVISSTNDIRENVMVVDDTYKTLLKLAEYKRKNIKAKYIGLTGSVGKTSTKEYLKNILSQFGNTFANRGNFNNHIGVPLTLASIPEDAEYVIIEMGMSAIGEIRELTNLVKPDIAIITTIGEAHIEFLGSIENICKAKCEIFESLYKNGFAIINSSSPYFDLQKKILENLRIKNTLTFGALHSDNCKIEILASHEGSIEARFTLNKKEYNVMLPVAGAHNAYNIASCVLAAYASGINIDEIISALAKISAFSGRGDIIEIATNSGIKLKFIDDAYNANPTSVQAALNMLSNYGGNKIAILSDMKELGDISKEMHEGLKDNVLASGAGILVTVGLEMKYLHHAVKNSIEAHHFDVADNESFANILKLISKNDSTILVKGSNSTKIRSFIDYCTKFSG